MKDINEAVNNITGKINENDYVKKVKQNKNYKYIKIGAIAVAAVIVICLLSAIFGGNKYQKAAIKCVKEDVKTGYGYLNYEVTDIKAKVVAKNDNMFVIDVKESFKDTDGEKGGSTKFYIVQSDKNGASVVDDFVYDDTDKTSEKEMKDYCLKQIGK